MGLSPVTSHETLPASIGGHRIERVIGHGGFGIVYQARDPDGRPVAVKRMHAELSHCPQAILRFEREIGAVRRIAHPNLAAIHDVGDDGAPYYAMELLHGRDLGCHLTEVGRLSLDQALEILAPLAGALSAAHAKGVVHRDLKASNVFLDRRRIVLLDFGVAKLLDGSGPPLTRSHLIIGSPACMAPEQVLGRPVDERTDVYGLAVLAYHMLAGSLPFNDDRPSIVQEMHVSQPPPPISRRAPVRPEVERAIARGMSKDPSARQASVEQLIGELEGAGRGAPDPPGMSLAVHIDSLCDDSLSEIVDSLAETGLEVAFEAGNAATLLMPLPHDPVAARGERLRILDLVGNLPRGGDEAFYLDVGDRIALLKLGAWVPSVRTGGVLAGPRALEGIDIATEPVPGKHLVRLTSSAGLRREGGRG
jgi:eukaryotic-like serine/threonine-protein kinase